MEAYNDFDYLVKLVLVGDSGVGKTCLLHRYADDSFNESFITTIGVDFKIQTREVRGLKIKQQLWDTAGQDRFKAIVSSYYRGADGLVIVFDLTDMESFLNVTSWLDEADRYSCKPECVKILIGNKVDLKDKRVVSTEQATDLANKLGLKYIETSAKTSHLVHETINQLTDDIVDYYKQTQSIMQDSGPASIQVTSDVNENSGWCVGNSSTCRLV